jgi:hypothetical protein
MTIHQFLLPRLGKSRTVRLPPSVSSWLASRYCCTLQVPRASRKARHEEYDYVTLLTDQSELTVC